MYKTHFSHKTVLITGASSGIGKELALALAAPNVHLIITARNIEALKQIKQQCVAQGANCHYFFVDVSQTKSIEQMVGQINSHTNVIDVLINNAGISQRSFAEQTQLQVDRMVMEVNFFSTVTFTKMLWPLLSKSKSGHVVLMSSLTGTFGYPLRSAYAAAKHATEGFFESWMLENKSNVFFTVVAPGRINTNISYSALTADGSTHGKLDEGQANGIPADVCAQKILDAIVKRKHKVYIVSNERMLIFANWLSKPLFRFLVKKLKLS